MVLTVDTVVVSVAVLLVVVVSLVALTDTELLIVAPLGTSLRTVAVTVIVALAPLAREAIVPVMEPLLLVNVPLLLVADTNVN